jgi:hypothetical protein
MNTTGKPTTAAAEQNAYKDVLATAMNVKIPARRDAVYHGPGSPIDAALADIRAGWICFAAERDCEKIYEDALGIIYDFDEAIGDLRTAWAREPEEVPAGDHRGLAFARNWRLEQRLGEHG